MANEFQVLIRAEDAQTRARVVEANPRHGRPVGPLEGLKKLIKFFFNLNSKTNINQFTVQGPIKRPE